MTIDQNQNSRPTSPHLQIYKWNITSITSIMHRFTGVMLYFSIIAISWYVVFYTYQININESSEHCDCPYNQLINCVFYAAVVAFTFALYYHFCNGIRHLFWDIGKGFEKKRAEFNGVLVIVLALIFTALTIGTALYIQLF